MNELVKVDYSKEEPTVSGRELHSILADAREFKDFYILVSKIKVLMNREDLKLLKDAVKPYIFKFGSEAITYLMDEITAEMIMPCKNPTDRGDKEKQCASQIIRKFNELFPNYELKGREVEVGGIGRIDIFALEKTTGRDVVIEIKVKNQNPNQQLIAYGSVFKNPVLIAITEEILKKQQKLNGIIYLTFRDLNIKNN